MWKRTTANIILFISILFLPWWFSVAVALIFLFLFHFFIEFVIAGFIVDMIFRSGDIPMFGLSALVIFALVSFLKTKLRHAV